MIRGYVIRYDVPELWFPCDERGIVAMRGEKGLNAETCREMLERGALIEHHRLLAGAVIYRKVQ